MEILRKIERLDKGFQLSVRVALDEGEREAVSRFRMLDYVIKVDSGAHHGRHRLTVNQKKAFSTQVSRIKGRWNAGLVSTSGLGAVDLVHIVIARLIDGFSAILQLFIGRRYKLSDIVTGIEIRSDDIARLKDAETSIFTSMASVAKAMEYADCVGRNYAYDASNLSFVLGDIDFAGAGTDIAEPFTIGTRLTILLIVALIAVAAVAAVMGLGSQLKQTFGNVEAANPEFQAPVVEE